MKAYLRDRSFGEIDRFTYTEGAGVFSGFLNVVKKIIPYVTKIFSKAAPVVKAVAKNKIVQKTAKELGDHTLNSGLRTVQKALAGENVSESLKKDLKDAANVGVKGLGELVTSVTPKTKRKKRKNSDLVSGSSRKKKKKKNTTKRGKDMFSR